MHVLYVCAMICCCTFPCSADSRGVENICHWNLIGLKISPALVPPRRSGIEPGLAAVQALEVAAVPAHHTYGSCAVCMHACMYVCVFICKNEFYFTAYKMYDVCILYIQAQKPFSLNNKYNREVQYMNSNSDLRDELMHVEYVRCKTLSNLFECFERNFRRFHSRPIEVHSCIHSAVELYDHRGVSINILFHSPTSRRSLEASRFLPISQSAWLRWSAAPAYYNTQ